MASSDTPPACASRMARAALSCALLGILAAAPAHAYIGPGAGLGAIALALALLLGVVLLLVGLVWYPLKRMLRGRKTSPAEANAVEPGE